MSGTKPQERMMTPTHNQMGFSVDILDPYTECFLQKALSFSKPAADLGCGFGLATRHLLASGVTVIANDICEENLQETVSRIPVEHRDKLTTLLGDATQLDLEPNSLGGIMAGRWVVFLTSMEAYWKLYRKMYTWLQPGGVLCVTVQVMKAFAPPDVCREYERRWERGVKEPGWVTKDMMWDYLQDRLPPVGYAWHPDELKQLLVAVGFRVDKCGLYGLAVPPTTIEQTELYEDNCLGIIAVKPE